MTTGSKRSLAEENFAAFAAMLRECLEGDPSGSAGFLAMLADDAVIDHPYAPGPSPTSMDKASFARHYEEAARSFTVERADVQHVYRCQKASVTVLEFRIFGTWIESGRPYEQQCISVVETRDGRISRYREYWNPDVVTQRLDRGARLAF